MNRAAKTVAALLLAGLLPLTAACNSGSEVTTTPNKKSDIKADDKPAKKPAEKPAKEAAKKDAKTGDTITLKGMEDGSQLDVTVVKVVDPAKSSDDFMTPESGKRWIGVQFKLVNSGTKAYNDSPSNGAQVADAEGQQFQSTFGDITAGPSMSSSVKLTPGGKALGWIVFEAPTSSKVTQVQFAMDSGFSDQTGQWGIG
ncbi:DUF4352 domain-containing protein [Streptomyces sp. NBC_01445]|uniref:DUF4352 domain-containing protein n=1 Tax=Streptomyces sp. NBC_01445 TaxID=2903869 RepID=UPI002DD9BBCF|nr:DUF4352 domain-containing protein [Streptomyces sp. NBC_01445]WSE02073.1 DUF4352 domain-containing protein [Streptomyces sp. NBC_01445]WSE10257.1 DUF4352 domain-containing protein [Streptomyces sp. NBC_01445]WSE11174.1 DUF4352 domain-containing protein [Streptomyces sp. NBC_01445]